MHKQKRISLNILLTACLLLASLWGGVILNAVKNRSTADATRWREFLYASQVDDREAYNYAYDETTGSGWKYTYGTWTDNIVDTLAVTTHAQDGDTGIKYKNGNDYEITEESENVFKIAKKDAETSFDSVVLYTKDSITGLYYDNKIFISDYKEDKESNPVTIKINNNDYSTTLFGGSVENPNYYITYPLNALYAKYNEENLGTDNDGNTNAPSENNNYGFKLYLDEGCTIEYVGKGKQSSTPSKINLGGKYYDIKSNTIDLENKEDSSKDQHIRLYVEKVESDKYTLLYNGKEYNPLGQITSVTQNEDQTKTVTIGGKEYTFSPTTDNEHHYYEYTIKKVYVNGDTENGYKLYLDEDHTVEYIGEAKNYDSSKNTREYEFNYDIIYWANNSDENAYIFDDPNIKRMKWDGESDTNVYLDKNVTASDNFAQNSPSNIVMLENYLNNLYAKQKSGTAPTDLIDYSAYENKDTRGTYGINNFYVSFGSPVEFEDDGESIKRDENGNAKVLSSLTVTAYLNNESTSKLQEGANKNDNYGVRIDINNVMSQTKQNYRNYYWYNYFDLTQISYLLNTEETRPLLNAYGLYTIVFDYTVNDYSSNDRIQATTEQYVYQFYLTDDTNYVMYPTLNNDAQELNEYFSEEPNDYSKTYFNMSTYNLPTYLFDASKYYVKYSHKGSDDISRSYETSFKLFEKDGENNKLGLLSIGTESYVIKLNDTDTDTTKRGVYYYKGNESTTLDEDSLYGYVKIKTTDETDDRTGLYLYLNGVAKYSNGMLVRYVAKDTPLSYYFPIVLTELGEYTFENKYLIEKDAYNFTVIEPYASGEGEDAITMGQAKNIFKNYTYLETRHASILSEMKYENGIYKFDDISQLKKLDKNDDGDKDYYNYNKDGGYNLIFLGTKSTFMKNKTVTPFQDVSTGVYADITGSSWITDTESAGTIINTWGTITDLSKSWTDSRSYNGLASQIPITNLSPVAFNLYGGIDGSNSSIYYWKKNLTQNVSKGGYFINGNDLTICGVPTQQNFTNGTSLERAGLYLIKVVVNYQGLSTNEATATQYFMFVIDNSDPEKYFWTGELDSEGNIPDESKLGMTTKYTNADDLKFYWAEPSYFQEDITTIVRYSSSYNTKDLGAEMQYTKNSIISSSSGSSTTAEGIYYLCIYYGQKPFLKDDDTDRDCQGATICVDRTAPTASFYKYSAMSDTFEEDNSLIGNGMFRLYSDKVKASGASITVKYSELNFNISTVNAEFVNIADSNIITTDTYFDYVSDSSILSEFYNLESDKNGIKTNDNSKQNLTLGSDNSATPSKLYIFYITDEAGNSTTYYYIFDNSTPRAVYRQYNTQSEWEIVDLDSTSISENTQLYWGDEKGIKLNTNSAEGFNTIQKAIDYINANTNLYKGLAQKGNDSQSYLTLPLSKTEVTASHGVATTTSANHITIVTRKENDNYNNNSDWEIDWKGTTNDQSINNFVSRNKTTYTSVITDNLGNLSYEYSMYLDTDLAQLTIFANNIEWLDESNKKVDSSKGRNTESINANSVVITFIKDVAIGIESYVTYSYYPLSMSSYFTATGDVYNDITTISNINGDNNKSFSVTYPFSKQPLHKNIVIDSESVLLGYKEKDTTMSQEGLYVLNRIYRYKDTKVELNDEQVANLSQTDSADLNMYIVVDRRGIVVLETDNSGNVISAESIGDLIYFKLGNGTNNEQDITAGTLNILANSDSNSSLFSSNRVKVSTYIPYDKYATAIKLYDNHLVQYDTTNDTIIEAINTAIDQNNTLYKLYISLLKVQNNESGSIVYNALIHNNEITEAGEKIISQNNALQQTFIENKQSYSLNHILSMVQSGTYRLYISDKQFVSATNDSNLYQVVVGNKTYQYTTANFSNSHKFDYKIEHKLPSGKYTSQNAELNLSNDQHYQSINKDTLAFEFEDYANIYDAKIDPNHFTVTRKLVGSVSEETLLQRVNGVYTVKPSNYSEKDISSKIFITKTISNDRNRYVINIFDKDNNYLSERDGDYVYSVTIYYMGQESFYDVVTLNNDTYETTNYYSATYTIHQDTTAPSQNLNRLKENAREYAGDVDENNYFFAIDKDNTSLTSSDADESYFIYLRQITSIDAFKPSLLPGDAGYGGTALENPSFNPSSVDENIYKKAWQFNATGTNNISFSNYSGYYELLELDIAKNITRYFVYIGDNDSVLYVNLKYNKNTIDDTTLSSVNYDAFDVNYFNSNPELPMASLKYIETFMIDDDEQLLKYNEQVATSNSDYYTINDTYYYFDKFVIVYIKDENGTTIKSIACDALNEKLSTFYTRVVEEFTNIQSQKTGSTYYLEILNRFGDNYKAKILLPDAELSLTITDKKDYFEVIVPNQSGNVYLTEFIAERANGSNPEQLSNDSSDSVIISKSDTGLQSAIYKFDKGDYRFTIIDNYGRKSVVYKFFGSVTDDKYTLNFGNSIVNDNDGITYTNSNVTLNINNSIWGVTCYYGQDLSTLNTNIEESTVAEVNKDYMLSKRSDSYGKYTYSFSQEGYYTITLNRVFAKQDSQSDVILFTFRIDRTLPKAYAVFDSGTQRELTNDSYSENITIVWDSEYDITGTLEFFASDGTSTTYSITKDTLDYYINVDGTYRLTLTDAISNSYTWEFDKIKSSFAYFTVNAEGIDRPLQESKYTEIQDKTIIQYYYVKYSGETKPNVTIRPDSPKGISSEETDNSTEDVKEFKIMSSNTLSSDPTQYDTICIVRIVFVQETNDFANMRITEIIDKDGKQSSNTISTTGSTSYAKKLHLEFSSVNVPLDATDQTYYQGNTIYLLHYFNGKLVKQYNGETENNFDITRSGLHRFVIRDLCGNIQKWDDQDYFDLYVVNSVIYTINDANPIPNSFYNDEVKLSIIDKLEDYNEVLYTYTTTALLNGKAIDGFQLDANGEYIFSLPGYYNITITAITQNNIEIVQSFSFTIINPNVAMIAFNIPTSYGFTIESIYKNQANITNNLQNKTTLWLTADNENFGSGVFAINISYFDSSLSTTYYFSFKVWINEETPTIIPVNYTYGTKTSKPITLQYNGAIIYSQIGCGYIRILSSSGKTVNEYVINEESENKVVNLTINSTGEYTVALYNEEGKLVSSYKVIKTRPLNSSAKIIIIIVVCVVAVLTGVFIFLRRRLKFR